MPLIFQVLDDAPTRTLPPEGRVSAAEAAELINRSENFGLWVLEIETGHLHWSPRTFEIFGMEGATNPVGFRDAADCYHPDDRSVRLELLEMATKTQKGYQTILRIKDGAGGYKLIRSVARFKHDKNGKPVLYGIVHHIGPIEFPFTDKDLTQQ